MQRIINITDEFEPYPGITCENGKEHLKYRLGSDAFLAVELKESHKVIGNILRQQGL